MTELTWAPSIERIDAAVRAAADKGGLTADIADKAIDALVSGNLICLGVAGWLASGKDTVAEGVYDSIGVHGDQLSFAYALKSEIALIIDITRSAASFQEAVATISRELGVSLEDADKTVDVLLYTDEARDRGWAADRERLVGLDGYSRTPGVRRALQYWGTDVRRAQDEEYWVTQGLKAAIVAVSENKNCYFTDCRFPVEVAGLQAIGIPVTRLDITRETQAKRLWERDGIVAGAESLNHESEIALDDFEGFALVVDNNGTAEGTVNELLNYFAWAK